MMSACAIRACPGAVALRRVAPGRRDSKAGHAVLRPFLRPKRATPRRAVIAEEAADDEAEIASHRHGDIPRSELIDDSEGAKDAARRAAGMRDDDNGDDAS